MPVNTGVEGKTVLVTAASKGLGFATALAFAKEGANVMISSRSEAQLASALTEIETETGNRNISAFAADVSDLQQIEALFRKTSATFGTVDILINNAGGPPAGSFQSTEESGWELAFQLSLMSVVRATRLALPGMREKGWGRIVNFTSSSMKQPLENLILSNTFRTAVAGLSKSLAIELGPSGILVNAIGAGRIATDRVRQLDTLRANALGMTIEAVEHEFEGQIPVKRYGSPEEFANIALFLGSVANGYITGQSILVDGGLVKAL
jgi:3-oxoacyl-[acyl-carrier protein] reductase